MKKLLTLMLILSMVLILFAACGGEPAKTQQKPTGGNQQATGTKQDPNKDEWGRDKVDSSLPADLNFNGETVNIFLDSSTDISHHTVDELNDDIINDAVYNRNIKVEEDLGVELNWIVNQSGSFTTAIDAMVFNATGDYDICSGYGYFLPAVITVNTAQMIIQ